ncbi:MAG: 50S ribosomal protein L21 [Deltaproteobacteria bacterium]|nr:50S ribosomal protein L21 [Deltaproteobacteria bacterium]MBW2046028.1 50S ribosomal protein L21 [Deltaproteobacteria bacterium]MBW2300160.1 50S ribosomal protein L21 [Deltaproteobacteria bacterium]RLB33652.1 MAG: 50S ribosomal protein L21 [Deltaproteobacteria bacterium]
MYAIIKTGGKQYRISEGEDIRVEKLPAKEGDTVVFDQVLLTSDGDKVQVGRPFLENVKVVGRVKRHERGKKIVVFKYKRRKGYRKKQGHRQDLSLVGIERIEAS